MNDCADPTCPLSGIVRFPDDATYCLHHAYGKRMQRQPVLPESYRKMATRMLLENFSVDTSHVTFHPCQKCRQPLTLCRQAPTGEYFWMCVPCQRLGSAPIPEDRRGAQIVPAHWEGYFEMCDTAGPRR